MGAGTQRWWRDHEQECIAWDEKKRHEWPPEAVRCITEDGIELRLRLYLTTPGYHGTCSLVEGN